MIRILAVAAISLGATQASSAQTIAVPSFQSVELAVAATSSAGRGHGSG